MKEKITICIPTKDRSDFLRRLLYYFAREKFRHWLFIGDSSNDWHLKETKKVVNSLKNLKIKHFECPKLSDAEAIAKMNEFITTPYAAFLADDDLLSVSGLEKCMKFLDKNRDFGAAHGLGIGTRIFGEKPYGKISYVHPYPQVILNADSGSQRLKDYFASGPSTLIFSVHRTQDWRDMHDAFVSSPTGWARQGFVFNELIPASVSSIRNKVKELDCLYLLRLGHSRVYRQVEIYKWFTSPDWFSGFNSLQNRTIEELVKQDNISQKEAEQAYEEAVRPYLFRLFSRTSQSFSERAVYPWIKKIDRIMPGFKNVSVRLVSRLRARKETNLLPSLLKADSPHYRDFLPIYKAITEPEKS
jgi:glycosyltransferase domain-containing protein